LYSAKKDEQKLHRPGMNVHPDASFTKKQVLSGLPRVQLDTAELTPTVLGQNPACTRGEKLPFLIACM